MRTLLYPVALCLLALPLVRAQDAVSSERTQQVIRERLPKFDPNASDAARQRRAALEKIRLEREAAGEEVVVLPEVQVRERRMIQPSEDDWLSGEEVTKKAMVKYSAKMNDLELALNRWHIPLFSASFAARARADYEAEKRAEETARLDHINKVAESAPKP